MRKFKVGDKVKVIDIKDKEVGLSSEMKNMLGDIFTIESVTEKGNYRVEETEWVWGESNLELVVESKFKTGDKVRVVSVEQYEVYVNGMMKQTEGETFTIKGIKPSGNYTVEENYYVWGESNLELVNETVVEDVQKVLKVWELEEGKEYREVTKHTECGKLRIRNDELEYTLYSDWYDGNVKITLGEILSYEFIEIGVKTQLEKEIDKLLETYSKDEITQTVSKLYN